MRISARFRASISVLLLLAVISPTAALAAGGGSKKHFKKGMQYELSEEWDKASEEFALAVSGDPSNPEYRLHLQRALFNASQLYMKRGTTAAKEKDYEAAYVAFRKAYAYDPTNELAKSEMDRMIRLQQELKAAAEGAKTTSSTGPAGLNMSNAAYDPNARQQTAPPMPQKLEKLRDVPFPSGVNLQFLIKELARDLDLNVLFESESRLDSRTVKIDLKNVTAARALDYVFLQEGLFFQRVGPRTILVATNARRNFYQQLVLRTFYLANAAPKDVAKVIQTAIPTQQGRAQTIVLTDDATNSVTVRDTAENVRIIGRLISALDKDRAEVVMDVAIYEVNKNDLMQFGNQIGDSSSLLDIGGVHLPQVLSGTTSVLTQMMGFPNAGSASVAIGLPASAINALQTKSNTKLIASTQIHAFNNEDSSARIGQRVPVQTAQYITGTSNVGTGVTANVVNYEQVGLTLKFKPLVFPNQDVQVAMEIESKDVAAGGTFENPIFTERTIKGTARVQNNKTLLLASVAQGVESKSRTGLPLIGLIPVLGRLFTAPRRENRQVDIVIAITPRVIRAPAIFPEDEAEHDTGSVVNPTSGQLEAMIENEDRNDAMALARSKPTNTEVQLPDQPNAPGYVRTADNATAKATETPAADPAAAPANTDASTPAVQPIDASAKTLQLTSTSTNAAAVPTISTDKTGSLSLGSVPTLKKGEKATIAVQIAGAQSFASALVGLRYDAKAVAVRSIKLGDSFSTASGTIVTPFVDQDGKTYFTLASKDVLGTTGALALVEIEALSDGVPVISLDKDVVSFTGGDGKRVPVAIVE